MPAHSAKLSSSDTVCYKCTVCMNKNSATLRIPSGSPLMCRAKAGFGQIRHCFWLNSWVIRLNRPNNLPQTGPEVTSKGTKKLLSLEAGRGLAAFSVVMFHASHAADNFTSGASHTPLFAWGTHGVDFFFVLSGFIIYFVHCQDERGFAGAKRFLGKRIRRIYIPYLPVGILLGLAYVLFPTLSHGNREWGWATTLTLLPFDRPASLTVSWTLVYEIIFYLIFLSFYAVRRFGLLMAFWGTAVISLK